MPSSWPMGVPDSNPWQCATCAGSPSFSEARSKWVAASRKQPLPATQGLLRELNPGPLAPEARIIPLDQAAMVAAVISSPTGVRGLASATSILVSVPHMSHTFHFSALCQRLTPVRAHPDLNQGPADLQSAALTTELCTQLSSVSCNVLFVCAPAAHSHSAYCDSPLAKPPPPRGPPTHGCALGLVGASSSNPDFAYCDSCRGDMNAWLLGLVV
jgi:hypothetical protein